MNAVAFLIFLATTLVASQDTFPPCKWTSAQWKTFKQCLGTQTSGIVGRCMNQQSAANDWITVRNTICASQSKKDGVKNCLLKDVRTHSNLMKCNDRLNAQNSNRAG